MFAALSLLLSSIVPKWKLVLAARAAITKNGRAPAAIVRAWSHGGTVLVV
jgi:hypothetical protein